MFSNKTAQYTPALDGESFGTEFAAAGGGGKKQTQMLLGAKIIDGDIAINTDLLPEDFKNDEFTCKQKIWTFIISHDNELKLNINEFKLFLRNRYKDQFNTMISNKNKNDSNYNEGSITYKDLINKLKSMKMNTFNNEDFIELGSKVIGDSDKQQFQKYRLSLLIFEKTKNKYIKLKDLPNNKEEDIYDFGGGVKKTPKQFFSHQVKTNLKRLYKLQNRTLPSDIPKNL